MPAVAGTGFVGVFLASLMAWPYITPPLMQIRRNSVPALANSFSKIRTHRIPDSVDSLCPLQILPRFIVARVSVDAAEVGMDRFGNHTKSRCMMRPYCDVDEDSEKLVHDREHSECCCAVVLSTAHCRVADSKASNT